MSRFPIDPLPGPGRQPSAAEPRSPRSTASRFGLIVAIFAGIQAIVLGLAFVAVESINTTRAYVAGEGAYAKAQKEAALQIRRFVVLGDYSGYVDRFRRDIAVPIGDRVAREALQRHPPDLRLAYEGFLEARNDPQDIPDMERLFVWLSWWRPYALAVDDWREGDRLVAELQTIGEAAAAARGGKDWDDVRRDAFLARVNDVDERLATLEDSFSRHMGEAARAARDLVVAGLLVSSALLWAIGIRLSWRTFRSGVLAEQRLARSEQRFRDFAEVASDWFWEADTKSRVSYISRATSRGEEAQDFIGKSLLEIAGADPRDPRWAQLLAELAAHRPFRDFTFSLPGRDGAPRFWSVSGTPIHDDHGNFAGYRGTGSEITREVLAQRHLERAKEQAETANRAKSEFLANMSHELRTPLNAILGFAEIIRERLLGPIGDPRYGEYAHDIHTSGTHLLGIINDILDLSKVEAGRLELIEEIVDVQSIVKSVVLLLRERVSTSGLQLKTDLPDALLLIRADERKLKQVLMNLLSNAVKFTPSGGEIVIRVRVVLDHGVILEVRDSGIGIAAEDIHRALSPFGQVDSRLSRRYEGTGLGLPLAKSLIELHGGTLELESTPGCGTTVRITLPADRLVEREMRRWVAI